GLADPFDAVWPARIRLFAESRTAAHRIVTEDLRPARNESFRERQLGRAGHRPEQPPAKPHERNADRCRRDRFRDGGRAELWQLPSIHPHAPYQLRTIRSTARTRSLRGGGVRRP